MLFWDSKVSFEFGFDMRNDCLGSNEPFYVLMSTCESNLDFKLGICWVNELLSIPFLFFDLDLALRFLRVSPSIKLVCLLTIVCFFFLAKCYSCYIYYFGGEFFSVALFLYSNTSFYCLAFLVYSGEISTFPFLISF